MKKVLPTFLLSVGVALTPFAAMAATPSYQEAYRPQQHFSPLQQWMNDPNGMVYLDGEYHLFYQQNIYANIWGPMHWGHAVSKDLVHWEHLPTALFPDKHGAIFSGSAVFDHTNSSGLGTKENPPLVAIFTYHDHWAEKLGTKTFQTQGLAYSLDKGRTWTKYAGNPVLPSPGIPDFRDPKVVWHAESKQWLMTLAVKDKISFYGSSNLKKWRHLSDFGQDIGAHGGVWECPDLIKMKVEGSDREKYVLLVSINPGAPNGGSGTQYFVGDFDGKTFKLDAEFENDLNAPVDQSLKTDVVDKGVWLDFGTDNYAGVTWSNVPESDGRHLFIAWMNNWNYANKVPTDVWRSAMTLPRELVLVKQGGDYRVQSRLVAEVGRLHESSRAIDAPVKAKSLDLNKLLGVKKIGQRVQLSLELEADQRVQFNFGNGKQSVVFTIDNAKQQLMLDRSRSGKVDFEPGFAKVQLAPLTAPLVNVELDIVVDQSSIEIFVNKGASVFTSQMFPDSQLDQLRISSDSELTLASAKSFTLGSIWK